MFIASVIFFIISLILFILGCTMGYDSSFFGYTPDFLYLGLSACSFFMGLGLFIGWLF